MLTRAFRLSVMLFIPPLLEPLWNSWEHLRIIPATEIVSYRRTAKDQLVTTVSLSHP